MKLEELHGFTCYNFKKEVARSPLSTKMKCLVLESDPTPDYYAKNNFPPNKRDAEMHLYLPIKSQVNCFQDIVLRETYCFIEKHKANIHVTPGQMILQNENHQAIRIRGHEMNYLPMLIKDLQKLGIEFMKDTKIKQYTSTIFYKKFTEFTQIEEDVYQDKNNMFRYFFKINCNIELDTFLKGMKKIKNNCDFHMFDAFLSFIFIKNKAQDFIGVYSEHCDKNRFGDLKKQIKEVFDK